MIDRHIARRVVELMNEMLAADPVATRSLMINRTPCNKTLAEHPTVQVWRQEGGYAVTLMGILNGLVGAVDEGERAGWGEVHFRMEGEGDDARITGFHWTGEDE